MGPSQYGVEEHEADAGTLSAEVAQLVRLHVDAQMEALEKQLTRDVIARGQQVLDQATDLLARQVKQRIESIENTVAIQLSELSRLQTASEITARKVDAAAPAIQRSSAAVADAPAPSVWVPSLVSPDTPAGRRTKDRDKALARKPYVCPNCNSLEINRSRQKGFLVSVMWLFFLRPLRCDRCFKRFFRF